MAFEPAFRAATKGDSEAVLAVGRRIWSELGEESGFTQERTLDGLGALAGGEGGAAVRCAARNCWTTLAMAVGAARGRRCCLRLLATYCSPYDAKSWHWRTWCAPWLCWTLSCSTWSPRVPPRKSKESATS